MLNSTDYIFVLWSAGFDEMTATIFVTEFREAGLQVKIVGLTPQQINGAHGLALIPDFTLDKALPLASQAACVIIPSASMWVSRLKNDPRIYRFLEQAAANQATFVSGQQQQITNFLLELSPLTQENILIYPKSETLVMFVRGMADELLRHD